MALVISDCNEVQGNIENLDLFKVKGDHKRKENCQLKMP